MGEMGFPGADSGVASELSFLKIIVEESICNM